VLKSEGFSNIFHTSSFFIVSSYFIRCSSYPIHPYPKVSRSMFSSVEGWPTEATGSSSHGQNAGRADVQPGAEDLKNGYLFLICSYLTNCMRLSKLSVYYHYYQHLSTLRLDTSQIWMWS
jgi:hypothetical protein